MTSSRRVEIRPRASEIRLQGLRGRATFDVVLDGSPGLLVCFDIYAFQPQAHPENHLGWWRYDLGPGRHVVEVELDFNRIGDDSFAARVGGRAAPPENRWSNPGYRLDPLQDCRLAVWAGDELLYLKRLLIKVDDRRVLQDFYERHFRSEGYRPPQPFLDLMHKFKLGKLERWFGRYFKGRVLDVGCGLSLFTEIRPDWPFRITAGDLVFGRMKQRRDEVPGIDWTVFEADRLPFRDGSFEGLFAGEILEHLPDPERALAEWSRVLKPGGVLIVTTPNRDRRINRINGESWPFSPDHLRELSFEELNERLLPHAGFSPIRTKGIYLELWTRSNGWWIEDHLQRAGNTPAHRRRMQLFFRLGYLFPRRALVLMTVARKAR